MDRYCVYCQQKINQISKEHVIQNALGGLYESIEICCGDCNNFISKKIDVPFTSNFNSIISNIPNMVKSNNKKSKPSCTGKALYKGKEYDVTIKGRKVILCKELSKKTKGKIRGSEFTITSYDFNINNKSFKNGMGKIAFNFALDKGIPFNKINSKIKFKKGDDGKINSIEFDYLMIPFYPLNPFDEYIELETKFKLFHNLILFSQRNKLWCYVNLFNTFQYYILLSEKWDSSKKIYESYVQLLQKLDREIPDICNYRPKDILLDANFYDIEPCLDIEKFKRRIAEKIRLESPKKELTDIISPQDFLDYSIKKYGRDNERLCFAFKSLSIYFDDDNKLKKKQFRILTPISINNSVYYPEKIKEFMERRELNIKEYTFKKFHILNEFLVDLNINKR